jgi:hypothetical protein
MTLFKISLTIILFLTNSYGYLTSYSTTSVASNINAKKLRSNGELDPSKHQRP